MTMSRAFNFCRSNQ